jgi:hypothetical protein
MPTITVERLRSDGPFRPGDRYAVAATASDALFVGIVREIRPTGPRHVEVTVELSDAEHQRLTASRR